MAALQLWRLAKLTEDIELQEKLDKLLASSEQDASVYPHGMLNMLQAVMAMNAGGKEVVVSGTMIITEKNLLLYFKEPTIHLTY